MLEQIWDGLKTIIVRGAKFVIGAAKAAWAVVKFACKAAVWIVAGVFTIAGHLTSYVGKTLSSLFKPKEVIIIPPKKLPTLVEFLEQEAEKDGVADDPEVLEINQNINKAVDNHEAMIYAAGEDNTGQIAVSDPEFISANSYEGKIQQANDNNQIYRKRVSVR